MPATTGAPWRLRAAMWATDGLLLGLFMLAVGIATSLLFAEGAPLSRLIPSPTARQAVMALAMGATAVTLIYSPLGGFSGAHMNPAVTLAFWRLGRIRMGDALPYLACQGIGGLLGTHVAASIFGKAFIDPPVHYAVPLPGAWGIAAALGAEFAMTFLLMSMVLWTTTRPKLGRFTGIFSGAMVAVYVMFLSPVSGVSLNPARYLASAIPAHEFKHIAGYLIASTAGMFTAAELARISRHRDKPGCCKLYHPPSKKCLHCGCEGNHA